MRKHVVENMVDKKKVVEEMVGKPHAQRLDSPCTIAQLWHRPSCEFDPGEKSCWLCWGWVGKPWVGVGEPLVVSKQAGVGQPSSKNKWQLCPEGCGVG